jgi:hypothetical protein
MIWAGQHYWPKSFSLGDHVLWFRKEHKEHRGKFKKWWFNPYKIQYCLPNNIVLLTTLKKFEPNPILMNVNKLKPYCLFDNPTRGLVAILQGGKVGDKLSLKEVEEEVVEKQAVEGQGAQEWDTTIEETIGDIIANKNEDLKKGETTIGS